MSIQGLGSLAELLAAIATIVTLIYLAHQIRQSTLQAKTQYQASTTTALQPFQFWRADNPARASIYRKGMMDWSALTADERIMLDAVLHAQVSQLVEISAAHERGLLDAKTFDAWIHYVATLLKMPGANAWWNEARFSYEGFEKMIGSLDEKMQSVLPHNELAPSLWISE
jgi:hypothetical protein